MTVISSEEANLDQASVSRAQRSTKRSEVMRCRPGIATMNRTGSSSMKKFYVYILANRPRGVLYVGVTSNLSNRMFQHQQKLLPGFTKAYGVTRLVYLEQFSSSIEARARERSLKRLRRTWKFDLVDRLNPEWRDLAAEVID
jgi:putative endonuclease